MSLLLLKDFRVGKGQVSFIEYIFANFYHRDQLWVVNLTITIIENGHSTLV